MTLPPPDDRIPRILDIFAEYYICVGDMSWRTLAPVLAEGRISDADVEDAIAAAFLPMTLRRPISVTLC